MRFVIPRAGAALLCAVLLTCLMTGSPAWADMAEGSPDHGEIDRFVHGYVEEQGLAGVSVALVRNGEVLHTNGYGHDSAGGRVTSDTPMMTASLSKSITAMAVMRLVEDGEVELDAPFREYLPEFRPVDPRAEEITVRQLLDQTSGMSSAGLISPDQQAKSSPREAVEILASMELTAAPGAKHQYFNGNYWTLARMVEVITGEPFSDYLDKAVFSPLGMDDSTAVHDLGQAAGQIDDVEDGHVSAYGFSVPRQEPDDFGTGAGGVISTADDMARWLAPYTDRGATTDGEPFVSAATIDAMLTPSAPEGRYALGWRDGAPDDRDRPRMSHGGSVQGYSAYQGIYHEGEYGVVVLTNSFTAPVETAYPIAEGIIDIVEGKSPEGSMPVNAVSDYVLAALTLVTTALGTRRIILARGWAERLSDRSNLRLAVRLAPRVVPFALLCGFVALLIASGADSSFVWLWFTWPALGVWALAAIVANLATAVVRVPCLRRARSRQASPAHQP